MLTTTLERRRMQAMPNERIGNGATTRIQVLVVEDEPAISGFIRRGLALEGFDVRVVDDGNEAVQVLRDQPPDLVVLDVMLPGLDGIEITRRLRNAEAAAGVTGIPVIMLTARDAITDRVLGLEAGADDYLVKPFAFDELLARIRALLRRTRPTTTDDAPALLSFGDLEVDLLARSAQRGGRSLRFTTREFDLLVLFLRHPNQVLSRGQIMSRIWGNDFYGDSNVLEVFIGNLRRELEGDGRPRLIQTIRGAGYVLREQA
jgi:two-component system response regulator MprA